MSPTTCPDCRPTLHPATPADRAAIRAHVKAHTSARTMTHARPTRNQEERMTHPHGLTRADVAHLKAGDEVTLTIAFGEKNERQATLTGELYKQSGEDALYFLDWFVIYSDGEPDQVLVEVVSPRPPVPPMVEPTWLGAVVMTDKGPAVRALGKFSPIWELNGCMWEWGAMFQEVHPRPLTDAERRDLGIPTTLPEGWVAVDARDAADSDLRRWVGWEIEWNNQTLLSRVARAELARREATA